LPVWRLELRDTFVKEVMSTPGIASMETRTQAVCRPQPMPTNLYTVLNSSSSNNERIHIKDFHFYYPLSLWEQYQITLVVEGRPVLA
jgi:hypothetical protein